MFKLTDLEYLKLNWFKKLLYNIARFILGIPGWFARLGKGIWNALKDGVRAIGTEISDIVTTFTRGSWVTKVSYLIMGFGNMVRGQFLRGIAFFIFEGVFVAYMVKPGAHWLGKFGTLGDTGPSEVYDEVLDAFVRIDGDDSFKIMLYGLLTIFFIIAFVYTWRLNVKQNKTLDEIVAKGGKIKSAKDDLRSVVDDQFHKTLLALPLAGIGFFTVMPIIFMILVSFTNYDGSHDGYSNLFTWIGLDNFNELLSLAGGGTLSYTFGEITAWTLIWAVFATFTNYFLGMFVAIMINRKGIRIKKFWRSVLVLTIAIPQFVSLLYVSRMFADNGIVNGLLRNWGWIEQAIKFWKDPILSRVLVIVVNIWVGIPYLMLVATGILMNIPDDLYESAKIDGASGFQQYARITLPYMLFVTGPYLLTSFIGNINNFNVIYLLTWGQSVDNPLLSVGGQGATDTDLLITWLFKITTGATSNYKIAAVIAIMIFVIISLLSLLVYNLIPSTRREEDYS